MNSVFVSFYNSSYKTDNNSTKEELDTLFSIIKLPTPTEKQQKSLENSIQEKEILEAMALMHSGKSPGPGGFPAEWFKTFQNKLTSHLTRTYNYSFNTTQHEALSLANIGLILEKNKDPEDPASGGF